MARIKTLLYGYKNILAVENALIKIYYRKLTASQKFELLRDHSRTAKFLVLLNVVCAGAPFLGLFVILVIEFDVFEVLFEAYLLDNPFYRSRLQIILAPVISSVLLFLSLCECFRGLAVCGTDCIIIADSLCTIVYLFEKTVFDLSRSRSLYIMLTLISQVFKEILEMLLYLLLTVPFWILVVCMWINIKGFGLIPLSIQICSVTITFVLVVGLCLLFPKYMTILILCVQLVERHIHNAKLEFAMKKTKQTKIKLKQANALAVIRFKYGTFFYITKDFAGEYTYLLTQRIADVIQIY